MPLIGVAADAAFFAVAQTSRVGERFPGSERNAGRLETAAGRAMRTVYSTFSHQALKYMTIASTSATVAHFAMAQR